MLLPLRCHAIMLLPLSLPPCRRFSFFRHAFASPPPHSYFSPAPLMPLPIMPPIFSSLFPLIADAARCRESMMPLSMPCHAAVAADYCDITP